jgi:integrase
MSARRDAIHRLKPGESLTVEGVSIERLPDGDLRYRINAVVDGRRLHRVIGRQSGGVNYQQARAYVERMKSEAREGRLQLPKGRKLPMTFGEAAEKYISALEMTAGKNIVRKRQQLEMHLVPFLGDERLSTLSAGTLRGYRQHRLDEGASDSTINREMAVVSHLFSVATDEGWIASRPCRIPKVAEPELPKIVLSETEQQALLQAAMDDRDSYVFTAMALTTGMRHSEILAARYDQVDWTELRLQVPDAKAGPRSQPLTPWLRDILRRERETADDPAGWVFPIARPTLTESEHRMTMARPFARVVEAANLGRPVTPHLLRHTAVTRLIKAGIDLKTVQKISGHKTVAMLLRYLQTSDPEIDRAMKVLSPNLPKLYPNSTQTARQDPLSLTRGTPYNVVMFKKKG